MEHFATHSSAHSTAILAHFATHSSAHSTAILVVILPLTGFYAIKKPSGLHRTLAVSVTYAAGSISESDSRLAVE